MGLDLHRAPGMPPRLVGHRGACDVAPENTLASFQQALEDGADVIEMDLRLSSDGHVVIFHDDTLERTTNSTGFIADLTLAEIKRLDAGTWFAPHFAGERVPTLDEVLEWAKGKIGLILELKYMHYIFTPALVPATVKHIQAHDIVDQIAFIGYSTEGLTQVRQHLPDTVTGPLMSGSRLANTIVKLIRSWPILARIPSIRRRLLQPLRYTRAVGANLVAPNIDMVTTALVVAAHTANLPISPGGLNWNYPKAIAMGVDTISANDPGTVYRTYLNG